MAVWIPPPTITVSATPSTTTSSSTTTTSTTSTATTTTTTTTWRAPTTTRITETWPATTTTTRATTTAATTTTPHRTTTLPPPQSNPTTTPVPPITTSIPPPFISSSSGSVVPSQSTPATQTAVGINPTTIKSGEDGLPRVAVVGIAVAGVIIVGFITTLLVMKNIQRRRKHQALGQNDTFDHLPIDPHPPAPLMSHYTPHQKPYTHHHHDYTHDDYTQHHQNVSDQGGAHHHELEPMYNNSDYHQHPMDPYGTDGHQYPQHHPDSTYQSDFNQGQAHQGHFQDGGQGISDQGQARQSQPGHGIPDQPNAQQGGSDLGHQDPSGQGGHSDQNNMYHGRPDNQDPSHHFGGGQQPAPVPQSVHVPGVDVPMLPPVITSAMRRSKLNAMRPDSAVQYLASPTHSNATVDYPFLEDVSVSGSMSPGHRPLSTATSHRTSFTSAGGGGRRGGPGNTMQTWDENMQQHHQQQHGYSPRNEQAFLDQARYQDNGSLLQHSQPYIRPSPAGMHTFSRVLPVSPRIATIPPPQLAPEIRAPQDRNSEAVAAIVSTGNVSSLNTFDRRHPQLGEGQFADILSPTARDPQDRSS